MKIVKNSFIASQLDRQVFMNKADKFSVGGLYERVDYGIVPANLAANHQAANRMLEAMSRVGWEYKIEKDGGPFRFTFTKRIKDGVQVSFTSGGNADFRIAARDAVYHALKSMAEYWEKQES